MHDHRPYRIFAYHSCDKEVGLKVLLGQDNLKASDNNWDWLGNGIYFWEENPYRALNYAVESQEGKQFNKIPIQIPFVLGALIDLGVCLNLTESTSLNVLREAHEELKKVNDAANAPMPENKGNRKILDCAVIEFFNTTNEKSGKQKIQTIRGAFAEGDEVYPGSTMRHKTHIQICVRDESVIKAYFLPKPYNIFNPYL